MITAFSSLMITKLALKTTLQRMSPLFAVLSAVAVIEAASVKPAQAITLTIPTAPITDLNAGIPGLGYSDFGGGVAEQVAGSASFTTNNVGDRTAAFSALSPVFGPNTVLTNVTINGVTSTSLVVGQNYFASVDLYRLPALVVGSVPVPDLNPAPPVFQTLFSAAGSPFFIPSGNLTVFSGSLALDPGFQYFFGVRTGPLSGSNGVRTVTFSSIDFTVETIPVPVPPQVLGVALTGAMAAWRKRKASQAKAV